MTNATKIAIFISQTFRSCVVIFLLRKPMTFLSHNFYDTPAPAPHMNVCFEGNTTVQAAQSRVYQGTLSIIIQVAIWPILYGDLIK